MGLLVFGVLAFAAVHLITAVPGWKDRLKARTGERLFGPVFGFASLATLGLVVLGWQRAPSVPVYDPPSWGWHANFGFTFLAFLCLGIFLFRGSLRNVLRYPMGLAVGFWASGHLLANGDQASLILFGGMLLYALLHVMLLSRRGFVPSDVRGGHDLLSLVGGVALYGVMTQLHAAFIGVPILVLTR
jgi:uncharacterized membrane protein